MPYIIKTMNEIVRCGMQYRNDRLAPFGLKSSHASYLLEICREPGISQDRLAERICINKSNVARQAAILEEDGFIIRKPSESDKRCMELYPTEKTLELMPRITGILECWDQCLTQELTDEEITMVTAILERMKEKASLWMEEH